jgi:hypothetical protein
MNPKRITWIEQDILTTMTIVSGTTLLNQNSEFCSDTLHVVGSWYDLTTRKVSASRTDEKPFEKKESAVRKKRKRRLIILCAPRQLGAHKMAKTSPKTGYFRSIRMIRPHAKYQHRERARSRSEKRKQCFTTLGSITRRVSAHNGQYITSRVYVSAVTWHVIGA